MLNTIEAHDRLGELIGWLAAGWQIEEPILQRSVLHGPRGRLCAFEVIVARAGERRVLALTDTAAVQRWLGQHEIKVLNI